MTVSPACGSAQTANVAIQSIDSGLRNVCTAHIPGEGARMAGATERHQNATKLGESAKPVALAYGDEIGVSGGGRRETHGLGGRA